MLEWDRETLPELDLYTLTNLNSGEEWVVTMGDMKNSVYSDSDIMKMLSLRHPAFMLVKLHDKNDLPDIGVITNF